MHFELKTKNIYFYNLCWTWIDLWQHNIYFYSHVGNYNKICIACIFVAALESAYDNIAMAFIVIAELRANKNCYFYSLCWTWISLGQNNHYFHELCGPTGSFRKLSEPPSCSLFVELLVATTSDYCYYTDTYCSWFIHNIIHNILDQLCRSEPKTAPVCTAPICTTPTLHGLCSNHQGVVLVEDLVAMGV